MLVIARIDFGSWLRRVVTWDALLPIVIWLAPSVIEILLPNRRGAMEIMAVVLPITAVLLRFRAGMRHIASNRCSKLVRGVQVAVFMLGILPLILFDCFMILSHIMPAAGPMPAEDVIVWSIILSVYLTAMVIAMYPGRLVDDNPFRTSIESPGPAEIEGRQWQPPWAFFALVISCIICGAWAAVMPRHEPMRRLIALNSVVTGAGALALLFRSARSRAVARESDNRQRPPADAVVIRYWRRLFASRKRLIVEAYLGDGVLLGVDSDWDAIIESGRARLRGELDRNGAPAPSAADFDQLERRWASSMRIVAGWMTFWTAFLPAALLAAIICWRGLTVAWAVLLSLSLFPLLALLGLFLQMPFAPVFIRVTNRQLAEPRPSAAADA